jgi:hypothetical protein
MHGDNKIARLNRATGNANFTTFLLRLAHWTTQKCVVEHDGRRWVANSKEEWGTEVGLSLPQVKRLYQVGLQENLIETMMRWHRKRWVLHTRLTERAVRIMGRGEAQIQPSPETGNEPDSGSISGLLYIHLQEHIQEHAQEHSYSELTLATAPGTEEGFSGEIGELDLSSLPESLSPPIAPLSPEPMMVKVKSVAEVEAAVKAQKMLHKPDSVTKLGVIWTSAVTEKTGVLVPLKAREFGQLKNFRKLCPEGTAEQVLQKVLDDWIKFAVLAKGKAGLKSIPKEPHIGFLLTHASLAIAHALKEPPKFEAKKPPKPVTQPKSVQSSAQSEEKPATLDEILAILNEEPPVKG